MSLRNARRTLVGPLPTSAPSPADSTVNAGSYCFSSRSAVGERQMFPTHTTRILLNIADYQV